MRLESQIFCQFIFTSKVPQLTNLIEEKSILTFQFVEIRLIAIGNIPENPLQSFLFLI